MWPYYFLCIFLGIMGIYLIISGGLMIYSAHQSIKDRQRDNEYRRKLMEKL